MFKKTADAGHYLTRTGSHATKPSPTGRIDDLPAWAKEPEEYYRSLRQQFDALRDRLETVVHARQVIDQKTKATLPYPEFKRLDEERNLLIEERKAIEAKLGELRPIARAAALDAWGRVYYFVAQHVLDVETRKAMDALVQEWLGRKAQEIEKGDGERSAEYRTAQNRRRQLNERRQHFQLKRADQGKRIVTWEQRQGVWCKVIKDE